MSIRNISFAILLVAGLTACGTITLPPGQEDKKEFVQITSIPYREAYQVIAKQMRACYRAIGLFGNGYDVLTDLDTAERSGRIELYHVGLAGASKPEDSVFSRTVTIKGGEKGSVITTRGTTAKYVYVNHLMVASWLTGNDTCGIPARSNE